MNQIDGIQSASSKSQSATVEAQSTISQRRADAAVLMAESSLQAAGREMAAADRYQVIVSVEASELSGSEARPHPQKRAQAKRPTIKCTGPVARETARRIACDCSITHHKTHHGEPTDIGRLSRLWPAAMTRAIKDRDQHCQFPAVTKRTTCKFTTSFTGLTVVPPVLRTAFVYVLVITPCCMRVATLFKKIDGDDKRMAEQFANQQHVSDIAMFDVEKQLRNDKASFAEVRALSPTRLSVSGLLTPMVLIFAISSRMLEVRSERIFITLQPGSEDIRISCGEPALGIYTYQSRASHTRLAVFGHSEL